MTKYAGVQTLEFLKDAKKYNQWIMDQFLPSIKGSTMEIGAGIGNISNFLKHISPLYVSDIDPVLVNTLREKFAMKKNIYSLVLDITKKIPVKLQNSFDNVVAINVLEHIAEDAKALQGIHGLLKKNGKVFLLVPAKQFAYSKLDASLGHIRRYEKENLEKKLLKTGFLITSLYYFNPLGLLGWVLRDKFEKDHTHLKSYQVKIFEVLVPILKPLHKIWKPSIGISLIAIAQKV